MKTVEVVFDTKRHIGTRNPMIYGQFLEHFHRQVYGGVYDPGNSLSDAEGFREDVIEAAKKIRVPVVRWPGGCFVSAYHWMGGIGKKREPYFDKAWCVEESNEFGTDEYIKWCNKIGAEPYICTNAGSGTAEEMSDWVEYCNQTKGKFAKLRAENGHAEPYNVKYWSIGNENYGTWEIGTKSMNEWSRFVTEAGKMIKRVDPKAQLFAASVAGLDWNTNLLRESGFLLDWVSIHGYWDGLVEENNPSSYEKCMIYSTKVAEPIDKIKNILGSLDYTGKIKVAYDEWNLRSWHHPGVMDFNKLIDDHEYAESMRDKNDLNSTYTMADAVFSACFLASCLRNCDTVQMANFSPLVNTRGAIYTYKDGIVLRPTYHVFDLFVNKMGSNIVDSYTRGDNDFICEGEKIECCDVVATTTDNGDIAIALINRNPDESVTVKMINREEVPASRELYTINGPDKDSYNDINAKEVVGITCKELADNEEIVLEPHSVNVLVYKK